MSLEFIEKGHKYLWDGEEVPSVSEIIRFLTREVYQEPDKVLMDTAADRGTRVHKATEELDRFGTTSCDGDIDGYVSAYVKFHEEHDVEWSLIEQPFYNAACGYAGTLDRAGMLDGKPVIVDIKTTKTISAKHKLLYGTQLTAYKYAWDYVTPDLYVLQLKDDGTYKLIKVENQMTELAACLALQSAFAKTKRRKKKNG